MKKKLQVLAGIALGIFLLWFLFRDTDWPSVGNAMRNAHPGWLLTSLVAIVISFFTRVQRWSYIVSTAKPVSFRSLFSATQIGFLANFTLPGRAGELIRGLVLTRLEQIPFTKSVAFVALDRVTDLFGLLAVMGIALVAIDQGGQLVLPESLGFSEQMQSYLQPERIRQAALVFLLLVGVLVTLLVLLYTNQRFVLKTSDRMLNPLSHKLAMHVHGMLQHFADGLHIFRSVRQMFGAIVYSLATWLIATFSYYACIRAFGIEGPWYTSFVVITTLSLAISIPGAPGFVGQFQIGVLFGLYLTVAGLDIAAAQAAGIMAHLLNLVPVLIIGLYCLSTERLGLIELQRESEQAEETWEEEEMAHAAEESRD